MGIIDYLKEKKDELAKEYEDFHIMEYAKKKGKEIVNKLEELQEYKMTVESMDDRELKKEYETARYSYVKKTIVENVMKNRNIE